MDDIFTAEQAAKRLGLTKAGVYWLIKKGRLDYVLHLNRLGVPKSAIQNYIAHKESSKRKAVIIQNAPIA